jgi:hypothetical protein
MFPRATLVFALALTSAATLQRAHAQSLPETATATGTGQLVPFEVTCSATLGRSVSGDFDGDGRLDVAQIAGNEVWILPGPAVFRSRVAVPSGVDLAVLPSGVLGVPDVLLVAEPGGLARHDWNPSGSFDRTLDAAWAGARRIAVWPTAGGGGASIFGVLANGRTLARASGNGLLEILFVAPAEIQEFELLDFDGGDVDIALVCGGRLYVYGTGGAVLATSGSAGVPSKALTVVGRRPVWSIIGPGGVNEFVVTLGAPSIWENLHGLPGVVATSAGDFDGDGDEDLVLSVTSELSIGVLANRNSDGAPSFDVDAAGAAWRLRYGAAGYSALSNHSRPAVGDFDGDGKNDIWLAVQSSCAGYLYRNNPEYARTLTPGVFLPVQAQGGGESACRSAIQAGNVSSSSAGTFALTLTFGPTPSWAQRLEIEVWRQATRYETVAARSSPLQFVDLVSGQSTVTKEFFLEESVPNGVYVDSLHYVVARYTSPSPARRGPSLVLGFQIAADCGNFDYLEALEEGEADTWTLLFGPNIGDPIVGTVTQLLKIPGMSDGNPPHRP